MTQKSAMDFAIEYQAEIRRLKAQNRDLLAALERLTSSNEDYAFSDEGDYMCAYCNRFLAGQDQHYPDCPILQARAAIAAAEETHD